MSMLSRYASLTAPAAAIQYVGGTTAQVSAGGSATVSLTGLTGGIASAPAANDLVIVYYGTGSTNDRAIGVDTAGYTEVAELYANDSNDTNLSVSYKLMGASPDTDVVVSNTGSNQDPGAVVVQVWRGVDPVLPLDVVSTTATGTNSVLCTPPSISPATAGTVIVAGGSGGHNAGVQTFTSSDLSNFATVGGPNSTNDVTVGVGSKNWTFGAFAPAAFGFSTTDSVNYSWAAVSLALRPNQSQVGPILIAQASTSNSGSGTSLVIDKPTGTRENDLMVAVMNGPSAVTWTGDTNWTEVADQGANPATRIAYKVAGASEGASYTFTSSGSTTLSGTIATYRNAAYDAVGSITTAADPLVVGAVTASVDYARILATVARAAGSVTITGPATMETVALDADATSPSRLVQQSIAVVYAGSSGTRSFTVGSTSNVSGALVAVKPAASYTKYAQYAASNSSSGTLATTVTVNTPAAVPGNLLLFIVSLAQGSATNVTVSTPSGWTLLTGTSTTTTAYQPGLYVFYRIATGAETASYTATASTTCSITGAIVRLVGVDATTLANGNSNSGSGTTSIDATTVTATTNGILIYIGAQANNDQGPSTFTPPTGMTEAVEVSADQSSGGGRTDMTLEIAYQEGLSAGATGTKTGTASAATGTNRFIGLLVTVGGK